MRITVDSDIPLPRRKSGSIREELTHKVRTYANTARLLAEEGLDLTPTGSDERVAADIVAAYAANPEEAVEEVSDKQLQTLTAASLVQADAILSEFGKQVVHSSTVLRHTVTNKLLLETENPDARVRLKALELLGKISDVGLFVDKSEVTITHKTSDELRDALRQKLQQLKDITPPEDMPTLETQQAKADEVTDADFEEVFTLVDSDVEQAVKEFDDYDD